MGVRRKRSGQLTQNKAGSGPGAAQRAQKGKQEASRTDSGTGKDPPDRNGVSGSQEGGSGKQDDPPKWTDRVIAFSTVAMFVTSAVGLAIGYWQYRLGRDQLTLAQDTLKFQRTGYLDIVPTGVTEYGLGKRPATSYAIKNIGGAIPIRAQVAWLYELTAFDAPVKSWDFSGENVVLTVAPGQQNPKTVSGMPLDGGALKALTEQRAKIRLQVKATYGDATTEVKTAYLCYEWTGGPDHVWPHYCQTPTPLAEGGQQQQD